MADAPIKLMLADVDGTLVTNDKVLTDRAIAAVHKLRDAGITFAVTSGRPPRGMAMLVDPLGLDTPIAAFNGGLFVHPDMSVIESHTIPEGLVEPIIGLIDSCGLDAWIYRGADWFVLDPKGPHVDREQRTVRFPPTVTDSFADLTDGVAKIVGVSDDFDTVAKAEARARDQFGDHVSAARSQPYYLDVTHPQANKGGVVAYLSKHDDIAPEQIATIGDMPNDVLMFTPSGLSIAMGNASADVQAAADHVTASNEDEGFAQAVEQYVLPR
jgi:Cof subfamily protein (haloacid dehalogenase superfamily)